MPELPKCEYDNKVFWIEDKSIITKEQIEKLKRLNKKLYNQDIFEQQLNEAIENEDYERAAELRDKIQKK